MNIKAGMVHDLKRRDHAREDLLSCYSFLEQPEAEEALAALIREGIVTDNDGVICLSAKSGAK